ncbi:hypothetical protein ACIQ6V_23725 [Streptomyces sp. NPDC096198]|uniref:hypothetical protein n=1 Tax=Streptomyces sp. NPDC096198 TaxID=3366080 RepID=UPI003821DAFF
MPADEVTHGTDVDASRARTGPRHAAPRKPLFTRFHVPAGKAIALAAMPTAVLMGMGLTPTLARADDHASSKSMTADEYQKCVEVLGKSKDGKTDDARTDDGKSKDKDSKDPSATPSPSASPSTSASEPSASSDPKPDKAPDKASDKAADTASGTSSSSDSGSDDKAAPAPSASSASGSAAAPSPSAGHGGVLDDLGDALKNIFTPGGGPAGNTDASATPSPSATKDTKAAQDTEAAGESKETGSKDSGGTASSSSASTTTGTAKKLTDAVKDTVKDTTDTATKAADHATKAADDATKAAESATPSPSDSATAPPADCKAATDDEGGVEKILALPDAPWHLQASSLTLKGADYQGIVKVRTANGTVKRVLKYVISNGTDIGDLHQIVQGQGGETYHVQAAQGSHSTITDGKTVMYTESISGNLLGLIPVTFSPDNPPPLNIPWIYFTHVNVIQAGQFGGTLTIPGMHQYITGAS